jgi:hypothetical protein
MILQATIAYQTWTSSHKGTSTAQGHSKYQYLLFPLPEFNHSLHNWTRTIFGTEVVKESETVYQE